MSNLQRKLLLAKRLTLLSANYVSQIKLWKVVRNLAYDENDNDIFDLACDTLSHLAVIYNIHESWIEDF